MAVRKTAFAENTFFHCYNRGVDKRAVFVDKQDYAYFLKSLANYNNQDPTGKLRLSECSKKDLPITILSYCLLPNHFHLLIKNNIDGALSKFMQRVSIGYTMYFNQKYDRSGSLFQGAFKEKEIVTDQDLRQVAAYVTFNYQIHHITDSSLYRSSLIPDKRIIRDPISNYIDTDTNLEEIVNIIKEKRLSFDEESSKFEIRSRT